MNISLILFLIGILGFSVFLISVFKLKIAICILCSLIICYHLLNLYLLHKFSNKKIKILEILPEFLINLLKEIELMSTTRAEIKEFKTTCYIKITIYLTLLILTIIII